jgi:hypothetical protein
LRRIFFNPDGTAITPGNFTSTGGTVLQKPDIAAADGVVTTLPANSGLNPFFGTSAAAPHAGAVAALLKSYNPALTASQMRSILTGTALDIEAAGADQDSGVGIVMALQALQAAPGAEQPTITSFTPASAGVGANITITGTKFNGATQVKFNGVSATFTVNSATQISATVPAGATTGRITVTTTSGTATSAADFTVQSTPAITSVTPVSGAIGSTVVVTGANLNGATAVKVNNVNAPCLHCKLGHANHRHRARRRNQRTHHSHDSRRNDDQRGRLHGHDSAEHHELYACDRRRGNECRHRRREFHWRLCSTLQRS